MVINPETEGWGFILQVSILNMYSSFVFVFVFILYVFCLYTLVCITCVSHDHGSQKRASDSLKLKLGVFFLNKSDKTTVKAFTFSWD